MSARTRMASLAPSSYRGRIALSIIATLLLAVVGTQIALQVFVERRVQEEVVRGLEQQAGEVAVVAQRDGADGVAAAARFLPGTHIVVRQSGVVIYWSDPVAVLDASASARRGDIEVTLERAAEVGVLGEWSIPLILGVLIIAIGAAVWWISAGVARRLRREATALAGQAEHVASGNLDARVEVPDDELGRVATALNSMTERLADAHARQRAFLADVAHELRTPVTAIDGFARALDDGAARTPEDRQEATQVIRSESARLAALVSDLQSLTLLDLGPEPAREHVDAVGFCRDTVARLRAAAAERGVLLSGPVPEQAPVDVVTDPAHVETILSNLITNALRATPAGGTVRVSVAREGGDVILAVSDPGVGIAPEHLPHIFDRLYRADPARDRESGGTGLGLAIVRRLTEVLGGRIDVQSALGEGSRFTLYLPAPAPPSDAAGHPMRGAAPSGST